MFVNGEDLVIRYFGRMDGLCLGSHHIFVVVWNILFVNNRLGGCYKLGAVVHLLVILVHDEAHQVVDPLLHIIQ